MTMIITKKGREQDMKRRLTIILALVLALAMSISVTLADFPKEGGITIPGATATGKNWISSNLRSAYAQTSGSTNAYVSVNVTFEYASPTEAGGSVTLTGSSMVFVKKTPVGAPDDSLFYKVSSTHTASYGGNSGYVSLTNEP